VRIWILHTEIKEVFKLADRENVRKNAGYTITDSIHIGDAEFVIGVSDSAPAMYVTWECKGGGNYFWGHYMPERRAAEKDLLERAGRELEILERRHERKSKEKERER